MFVLDTTYEIPPELIITGIYIYSEEIIQLVVIKKIVKFFLNNQKSRNNENG